MQNDDSNQTTKEIQLSIDSVEARNVVSLVGEDNKWNLNADRVPATSWDESPEARINSHIVSYSADTRDDEPSFFHF